MRPAILTDLTRCIGCEACVWACREANGLTAGAPTDRLSRDSLNAVEHRDGTNVRRQCMHCLDPACASVCPVEALHKTPEGPVVYDASRCIGCRYCMIACPFGIPKYEWDEPLPIVRKCTFCFEQRLSKGLPPACTAACPTGATIFGDRDDLIREAHERILRQPERYVDHIYGLEEAGGTSVLYLSGIPFEQLGFPTPLRNDPYPRLTWAALSKIPNVVGVGGVLLVGISWLTARKEQVARAERGATAPEEARGGDPSSAKPDRGSK